MKLILQTSASCTLHSFAPLAGRGLKLMSSLGTSMLWPFAPLAGRGLKLLRWAHWKHGRWVFRPARGARIETGLLERVNVSLVFRPARGARIETLHGKR